ncbi:MAG: DUF1259 domain-containing protein [Rhodospirillales bacterium]|nr:DUF1259 domain-containing protein [Rhodospirillales bacterium]
MTGATHQRPDNGRIAGHHPALRSMRNAAARKSGLLLALVGAVMGALLTVTGPALAADTDWAKVDAALGKAGADQPGDVHKYGLPRTDLHVTLDGVAIKPAFALGGWLAFRPMGTDAMVMGDLVLTEDEVNPVMARLLANGITVTALHNHLLRAQPPTFYMHVAGRGDPVALAMALREALTAESKTPFGAPAGAPAGAEPLALDTKQIDSVLGYRGKANSGVYQFAIARADTIREGGMTLPPAMGTAIAINFQPTANDKAAITGDFALLASEVTPVLQALRRNGIEVTALHNHMLNDQPRMLFVHFWANDDPVQLAKGLRAALNHVNVAKD